MNKMILSGALLGIGSFAALAPAQAANFQPQDQHISNFCQQHPYASECKDWKMNHAVEQQPIPGLLSQSPE